MTYIVKINDTEYEVEVERGQAQIVSTAAIAAAAAPIAAAPVAAPVAAPAAAPAAAAPAAVGEVIASPMPGTIWSVNVQPGDMVKTGQLLLILEAMKMENEILAPRDGRVGQVLTTKGSSVNTGDTLITLE